MKKDKPKPKILCIGDAHCRPEVDNRRFTALGNFIVDKRPDIIVSIGDFADMTSLSSYDKGTVKAEGKRYIDDIECAIDAQNRMFKPLWALQEKNLVNNRKRYKPEFYMTLGNHENRINRAANESPALHGHIKTEDLKYEEFGWKVSQFLEPLYLHNICFQHYFVSGIKGMAISGDFAAAHLVRKNYMSCVAGHSHLRQYWETTDIARRKRFGLVLGCYDEGGHGYSAASEHNWWSGLVMLNEVHDGEAEPSFWSTKYILEKYLP